LPDQTQTNSAVFHYFGNLRKLLKRDYRQDLITYRFKEHPGVKDAIEAMGVPHTEVDLIVANDLSVGFDYQLQHDDTIDVYPLNITLPQIQLHHLTPQQPGPATFILDVHLGKLARRLRLLGFDCHYQNDLDDAEIMQRSFAEERIILTRDRGILRHRKVVHGYLVRSDNVDEQVQEILTRFSLFNAIQTWLRCMTCNGLLEKVEKSTIVDRLEPKTRLYYDDFRRCTACDRLYWQGSHYEKIKDWLRGSGLHI
jgi:uncharacterized protein with PIN domain